MNIEAGKHYRIKDGNTAYIENFFAGDESNPAGYHGSVYRHGLTNWKTNGENMYTPEWDLVRELPNFTPIPMTPQPFVPILPEDQTQGGAENG